jgi:hypothetical protein
MTYLTWGILKVSKQIVRTGNSTLGLLITEARPVPGQVSDILEGFVKAQVYRLAAHVMCYFSPPFSGLLLPHTEKQYEKFLRKLYRWKGLTLSRKLVSKPKKMSRKKLEATG